MKRLFISILLLAGAFSATAQGPASQQENKLLQVYRYVTNYYVDTIAPSKVADDAIVGLLAELDPHSYYLTAEEMRAANEQNYGSFSGIGIEFDVIKDTIRVVSVMSNSPSESVGLLPNDRIIEVDGQSVIGVKRDMVPNLLRGKKGTIVTLKVQRRYEKLNFNIVRDNIPLYSVDASYVLDNGWGYIKVNSFVSNTMREFKAALGVLGNIDGLILDLSGNGGGFLERAIEMSEMFLLRGQLIMSMEGHNVGSENFNASRNGTHRNTNLIVMIDEGSASASEIVAGAMQDWDRGIIVGQISFGKGLVQKRFPLSDGSSVSITVARYHTPTGRVIQRPYELGEGDDYYIDHLRRTYDAEYADSVLKSAPHFKTLRTGRTVIGSGGIIPDVLVERDTTLDFRYWNRLTAEGIINEWVNIWLGTNRADLVKNYPTADKFITEFKTSDNMVSQIDALALSRGIERPVEAATSESVFREVLRALIARKIWDTAAYYRIVNTTDETYNRVLELIADWENNKKLLENIAK